MSVCANDLLQNLWCEHQLADDALNRIILTGSDPVFPSSFAVGTAAQVSMAAASGLAAEIGHSRGLPQQTVTVNALEAAIECTGYFTLNGKTTPSFAELSGLYQCSDGWLRIHANFDHHRDTALTTLGLPAGPDVTRSKVERSALAWNIDKLESAIIDNDGACAGVRTFEEWDALPQSQSVATLPLVEISKIGEADSKTLPAPNKEQLPLSGVRILDLTRILAGPVSGRTLAGYGAEVMLINSPELPNIDNIAETSRGKYSAHIDLNTASGQHSMHRLLSDCHVFTQGYRPGAMDTHGLSAHELADRYPGIIYTSLSAYGRSGPWNTRRGFDSLLQSASGFNMAEASAMGNDRPTALPMQILDYASGFLMAFGTQAALQKQLNEGGSWHVQVSLARTGHWLRSMGQEVDWCSCETPDSAPYLKAYPSNYGRLCALPHPVKFSHSTVRWQVPSSPPGTHEPQWSCA